MPATHHDVLLDCSGLAAVSDLADPGLRSILEHLERVQSDFLAMESTFRSPGYPWPRDALHNWSRLWEYPYAYHHLQAWRDMLTETPRPVVADIGSGVTFFPFAVAGLGCHVVCVDVDPICAVDLPRAAAVVPHAPGSIDVRLTDGESLPFEDGELDAAYCISVLEHVSTFVRTVDEMHRVLAPGGLLVLTIDLDLRGNAEIGPERHRVLLAELATRFDPVHPVRPVHPADMLTTWRSPLPLGVSGLRARARAFVRHRVVAPLLRRPAQSLPALELAVEGFVLRKRERT